MHQKRRLAIDLINNDLIIRNYITYNIRDLDQDQNRNRNSLYGHFVEHTPSACC